MSQTFSQIARPTARNALTTYMEKLYDQNPQHPGVTHFLIHAYDYHPLAQQGVPAARRYAGIAPAVPHARHMPSHIYSMVGLWEESIASNASAMDIQPDYYHAADFAVYAHLQLAQDAKAKALTEKSIATADRGDRPINFVNFTAKNAMSARYVLERADWAGAAALPFGQGRTFYEHTVFASAQFDAPCRSSYNLLHCNHGLRGR